MLRLVNDLVFSTCFEQIMLPIHSFNFIPSPNPTIKATPEQYISKNIILSLLHLHHQHSHMNNENSLTMPVFSYINYEECTKTMALRLPHRRVQTQFLTLKSKREIIK